MKTKRYHLIALALIAFCSPGCNREIPHERTALADIKNYFIYLDCDPDDDAKLSPVLHIADKLISRDQNVFLFVDSNAIALACKDIPQYSVAEQTKITSFFQRFHGQGGTLLVCRQCAAQLGVGRTSLRSGSRFANPDEIKEISSHADMVYFDPSDNQNDEKQNQKDGEII